MIFFTDKIEKFIPPKKGKTHILRIIRELIDFTPESSGTGIDRALQYLTNAIKKRSIVFLISDFMDETFLRESNSLRLASKKHDIVALPITDPRETELPSVGFIRIKDAETGKLKWIDTYNARVRQQYAKSFSMRQTQLQEIFKRSGIDFANIHTNTSYINSLMLLFKKRGKRR